MECFPLIKQCKDRIAKLSSFLRVSRIVQKEGESVHPLSPETKDPWDGVVKLSVYMQSILGDRNDVNHLLRARILERNFSATEENRTKLSIANTKISQLECDLFKRSKKISMQYSRISELEQLLTQTCTRAQPSDELVKSKEEITTLKEAIDVLQNQNMNYEYEIRSLRKSPKSIPNITASSSTVIPKHPVSFEANSSFSKLGNFYSPISDNKGTIRELLLEAAFFRPALNYAHMNTVRLNTKVTENILHNLYPLNVNFDRKDLNIFSERLFLANAEVRLTKAKVSVVKLGNSSCRRLNNRSIVTLSNHKMGEEILKRSLSIKRLKEEFFSARLMCTPFSGINSSLISDINYIHKRFLPGYINLRREIENY